MTRQQQRSNVLADAAASSRPGIKTSEMWMTTAAGGGITQIVTMVEPFEWQHAVACCALAFLAAAYTLGRSVAKRCAERSQA